MEITGKFIKNIFRNKANGYTVALFEIPKEEDEVIAVGFLPEISSEDVYTLTGDYVDHPKYGVQFQIESFTKENRRDEENMISYLSGPLFNGIGKQTAKKIVEALGIDVLKKVKEDASCLEALKLSDKVKAALIKQAALEEDDTYGYLLSHQMSMRVILKLEHQYKEEMMNILNANPYQVVNDNNGVTFPEIDKFALASGIAQDDERRLKAIIIRELTNVCFQTGDSYQEYEEFLKQLDKVLGAYDCDKKQLIDDLIATGQLHREQDRLYPMSQYRAENYIAQYLTYFPFESFQKIDKQVTDEYITQMEQEFGIIYQEKQKEAIEAFFENDLLILTGGPGTGKTTIVKAMATMCQNLFPYYSVTLAAPTGRAAKRLAQLTGCQAKTIHSLLGYDLETGTFAKDEDDPLLIDLLIIDEFSMVDTWLFYNLLKACGPVKKIILIGDQDQLPSVSCGALLRDLIDCNLFKVVQLEKIYRQKEGSDIISLASAIRDESITEINEERDIRFFSCSPVDVRRLILQIVEKAIDSFPSFQEGLMNVQVLAPMYKGINGIDNLNVELQQKFNPPSPKKKEIKVGYRIFRENDKILQLKNQPDDDVYNGDIGTIIEIIPAVEDFDNQERIIADFEGTIVEYTSESFSNISHAYCMSVHKAQGSEYPIVIMPLVPQYSIMLKKRLIYTAVTRANRNLIMLGDKNAFYHGVHNHENHERRTTLKERLLQLAESPDDNDF